MFEKNINVLDNLSLKRRLSRISSIESRIGISYCITPSNDYVLLKDDVPIDDLNNPREAAKKMLSDNIKNNMESHDIIIEFGLGLGYLLDEAYTSFSSRIYVYEPDLNLLHFVFSNVDLSEMLASGRVFITNDLDELVRKLSDTFITNDKVEIVYLQNYAITKNKELLMMTQRVYDSCKSKMVDVSTIVKFSQRWLTNTLSNMAFVNSNQAYLLSDLESKFEGQTALIAAAGPSLNDNIKKIQANRDKFVILAVNKVVKYLIQNGITPDYIVCLDAYNMTSTMEGLESALSRANCIMDIRTDTRLVDKGFNKIFFNFTPTDFIAKKLLKYNDFMKFYESGGSASTFALVSAIKMGFSKIVLAGVDLAFKDNVIYSTGETMQRVSPDEIIVDNIKKNLIQIKSVNGSNVYTREDYKAFIYHFETLIKELNYTEIYNISSFGAYISGVKNTTFEELNLNHSPNINLAAFAEPFKFNMKEFIEDEFCHINEIISILSKRVFSPALVSSIVKSVLIYQYMQAEILTVLQKNFNTELAENFIDKTKTAIKTVVEILQKNKLI